MTEARQWRLASPSFAAITPDLVGDGVAYAALLLFRALTALMCRPRVLTLNPKSVSKPSLLERARFAIILAAAQLSDSDV